MRRKQLFAGVMAFALVTANAAQVPSVMAKESEQAASGRTYYVSTVNGNDKNDGLSEGKAFYSLDKINELTLQAGDKVLLECGSVFQNGYLHIQGSGSEEAPIVIGKYGDGNRPIISTNGEGVWYQNYGKSLDNPNHKNKGYVSSSILLYDTEYIEIRDLEITNRAPEIENSYNQPDVMNRTGVAAVTQNIGTADHIYLENLYIHDVIGNVYDKHMNNGGIYFTQALPKNESETGAAKYDDVKIENCHVENVNRWGIAVGYTYNWDKFQQMEISDDAIAEYGSTNVEIRNNYVKDAGGDSITTMYCDRPLVEYNVSDGAARQINDTDYAHSVNGGKVAAAVWPWKCKDAVFQYNEAFDTCMNGDGQAWDADWGDGTVYQYNYSHNNGGGSVMFCGEQSVNNVFRYNISQNDLLCVLDPAGNPDAHVYNNTFYVKENVPLLRAGRPQGKMLVENNIFYYDGAEPRTEEWAYADESKLVYDNNLYYHYANIPANDKNAVTGDPMFEDGGTAPTATEGTVHERTAFDGYQLRENSPAIDAGKVIEENGGHDFAGNEIKGQPDIGAMESNAEQEKPEKDSLHALIQYAETQKANAEYADVVPTVKEAFEKALVKAVAVYDNTDASQEEIDAAYEELLDMVHMLSFVKGETSDLKTLVDVVEGMNEELYTADSWSALQSALKDAKDVLADKDAMQAEIDKAREALQDAKDALEERNAKDVDKTRLEKLVTDAKKYEDSIDKYTKDTADLFTKVLADAKAVLADDKASQEEVNLAHDALRNAIFGLRLIPNKDALKELIQNAEKVDLTKYTEKSVKAFRSALAYAKSVWEDENATEEDVKAAEKQLQKAQKNLVAKAEKPEKEDNQSGSADKNTNGGKTESADEGTTGTGSRTESTNKTTKAAKTGDAGSAMSMGMTLLAAMVSAGAVFTKRRKK